MQADRSSIHRRAAVLTGLAVSLAACSGDDVTTPVLPSAYDEAKLVADVASLGATNVDASLVNAWGLAFNASGSVLWVSNNGTGTSTLYNSTTGAKNALVVAIPKAGAPAGGKPTGQVFNPVATDFLLPSGAKASFIFSNEDGTIAGWSSGAAAVIAADRSSNGAVYKGLALATNAGAAFLYATNFAKNSVDVFDKTFKYVSSFTDTSLPAGYAPFGIHTIGGQLWVTFAKQGPAGTTDDVAGAGFGYVDVFNPDGTRVKRFVSNGRLNSPWGVALAPAGFGSAAGNILIGNFGDGKIGAYDVTTGAFRGYLHDSTNAPLVIDGLWDLQFGIGTSLATTLFFSAGPNGETHGLIGTLTAK
jgi:uncharacterized protein (TIGR03118 family)